MIASPLQWLSAILNFILSPILRYTRLQTSSIFNQEHAYYLMNTYKASNKYYNRSRCISFSFRILRYSTINKYIILLIRIKQVTNNALGAFILVLMKNCRSGKTLSKMRPEVCPVYYQLVLCNVSDITLRKSLLSKIQVHYFAVSHNVKLHKKAALVLKIILTTSAAILDDLTITGLVELQNNLFL